MNYKGMLQEYFMKHRLPIPKYHTRKVRGLSHCPTFGCTITLHDGITVDSNGTTKKEAEHNAARLALQSLKVIPTKRDIFTTSLSKDVSLSRKSIIETVTSLPPPPPKIISGLSVTIFIDLENRAGEAMKIATVTEQYNISEVIGFAATGKSVLDKSYPEFMKLVTVPSSRADGADIGIIMTVTNYLVKGLVDCVIVLTGDHFGHALVDCIRAFKQIGGNKDYRACCCSRITDIEKALRNLQEYKDFIPKPSY